MRRASPSPSPKSPRVSCVASSGEAPPAISSRQRSSRCWDSSSMISFSRVDESRSEARRARTCARQSGMLASRHAPYRLHERLPGLSLLGEHAPSRGRDPVEATAALVGLLDPGALDPAALLQAIQEGVEGVDV